MRGDMNQGGMHLDGGPSGINLPDQQIQQKVTYVCGRK